jgi:CRISPR-associated endonuclease Cas1
MREVYLLQFEFLVTGQIKHLHFYHGVYWSAIIREILRRHIPEEYGHANFLDKLGIHPLPVLNGITDAAAGATLCYNLILPVEHKGILLKAMSKLLKNNYKDCFFPAYSFIIPGKNIRLQNLKCLLSGQTAPEQWTALDNEYIKKEAAALKSLPELTLVFHTPLRMQRPGKSRERPWLDATYWDTGFYLQRVNEYLGTGIAGTELIAVETVGQGLVWLNVYDADLPLGGICGAVKIRVPDNEKLLQMLVEGQYRGPGKNRSLGLSFYRLAESNLNPLSRLPDNSVNLLQQAADKTFLTELLAELNSESAGPDNLTASDLRQNRDEYLEVVHNCLQEKEFVPGPVRTITIINETGKERRLEVRNIMERHLLQAIAKTVYRATDELIDFCVYAYRNGRGYLDAAGAVLKGFQNGFESGVGADIDTFFDSIDPDILDLQLTGLFSPDPVLDLLRKVIHLKEKGLEQGNPLSPLLSNLYLIPLDCELKRTGFHYVRYADDFVLLDKTQPDPEKLLTLIAKTLDLLHLKLSADKITTFTVSDEITYLGCRISSKGYVQIAREISDAAEEDSQPAFETETGGTMLPDLLHGIPVYVSFQETSVRCSETELLIESGEEVRHMSWKMISRIVVIGKPRISAGTIYKALLLNKPVVFLSITGKPVGGFFPDYNLGCPRDIFNDSNMSYQEFELEFIRSIALAKLNNQGVVLAAKHLFLQEMKDLQNQCARSDNPDQIRGYEGAGAAGYWKHYAGLIKDFDFMGRKYHPSPDPVNAMLSLGYSILYFRMAEALLAAGLSPWEGIFHAKHNLHFALASDMIEPYRFLVDRIVLALINKGEMKHDDFTVTDSARGRFCRLECEGFRKFINKFENTMHDRITGKDGVARTWAEQLDFSCRQLVNSLRLGIPFTPYLHKK